MVWLCNISEPLRSSVLRLSASPEGSANIDYNTKKRAWSSEKANTNPGDILLVRRGVTGIGILGIYRNLVYPKYGGKFVSYSQVTQGRGLRSRVRVKVDAEIRKLYAEKLNPIWWADLGLWVDLSCHVMTWGGSGLFEEFTFLGC